jgi:hypothetical protein
LRIAVSHLGEERFDFAEEVFVFFDWSTDAWSLPSPPVCRGENSLGDDA